MMSSLRRLLRYVSEHLAALIAVLALVGIVGLLEATSSMLIGPVFDAFLGDAKTPAIAIPFLSRNLDFSLFSASTLLVLLVGATIAKAVSEYSAVSMTAYLGH